MAEQPSNHPPLAPGISAVVPVYNSAGSIDQLIARLEPVLRSNATSYEIILVNDGSKDASWESIQRAAESNPAIVGIDLMRNYGQHNAILCGIRSARFDTVVTIDDDLQHPPEEIPLLLAKLAEGYDVAYGTPQEEQHGFLRDLASRLTKWALQGAMGVENASKASAFRVMRTHVRDSFDNYNDPFVSIDALLTYGTRRFSHVVTRHESRKVGQSNYTLIKLIKHALNVITSFSMLPLQFATLLGFAMTLFGLLILVVAVSRRLISGQGVPGFAFLASMIAIFSGTQMLALGIIGEYLARMHLRSMGQPAYTVRRATPQGAK